MYYATYCIFFSLFLARARELDYRPSSLDVVILRARHMHAKKSGWGIDSKSEEGIGQARLGKGGGVKRGGGTNTGGHARKGMERKKNMGRKGIHR